MLSMIRWYVDCCCCGATATFIHACAAFDGSSRWTHGLNSKHIWNLSRQHRKCGDHKTKGLYMYVHISINISVERIIFSSRCFSNGMLLPCHTPRVTVFYIDRWTYGLMGEQAIEHPSTRQHCPCNSKLVYSNSFMDRNNAFETRTHRKVINGYDDACAHLNLSIFPTQMP